MTPSSWFDSKVTVSDRTGSRAFLGEMVKVVEASPPAGTGLHEEGRGRGRDDYIGSMQASMGQS